MLLDKSNHISIIKRDSVILSTVCVYTNNKIYRLNGYHVKAMQ